MFTTFNPTRGISTLIVCTPQIVEQVYVNLIDLVEKMRLLELGEPYTARLFGTEKELADYSKAASKIMPRRQAKGLLQHLLRHIDEPHLDAVSSLPRFGGSNSSNTSDGGVDDL